MISQTAEYALRVVVFLGALEGANATTRQIAAATQVPEGYLAKILQNLGRAGLIRAQRGLHGGSVLAGDPGSISLFDVINAVNPLPRIRKCPLNLPSHGTNLCPLHKKLDDAMAVVEQTLRDCSLADLLKQRDGSIPLGNLGVDAAAATRAAEAVFKVRKPVQLTVSAKSRRKEK
jgi:Rrf2 family protein